MGVRGRIRALTLAIWFIGVAGTASANPFTFSTVPGSGVISGPAGSTIGWGYTLTNTSLTDWLVLTAVSADVFQFATASAAIFDFPVLAPGSSLTVSYLAGLAGLFELIWDPNAPIGFVNSGTFIVSAEWWAGDPFAGGSFLGFATEQSALYSASVTAPVTAVPEPSGLFLTTLGALLLLRRQRPRG
jgi:hypothetical protein